jgi:EAL domain-containing protein (putative c-di-GMP-specific phosphodiesterase class I)
VTNVRELLPDHGLRTVFQPLTGLVSGATVGVEALLRGPIGHRLENPTQMFEAARDEGLTVELDWASRVMALRTAIATAPRYPFTLFLNAEPEGVASEPPPEFERLREQADVAGISIVLEVTERALTSRPAELLRALRVVRGWGWGIAVDDVGAVRASLGLLPFLAPDVIKLDLRLVQQHTTVEIAEIINAVLAHAERTGALLVAEGIETPKQAQLALAMGATLGQGWLYGRPTALDARAAWSPLVLPHARPPVSLDTPWQQVRDTRPVRRATKPLLQAMSRTLERHAQATGEAAVILGAFQSAERFTNGTAVLYEQLARDAAFVAVFAVGLGPEPAKGVRGTDLRADDPLGEEWDVIVVGPHFAAALVAHDLHDECADAERQFDYALTYDRDAVLGCAAGLLSRIT